MAVARKQQDLGGAITAIKSAARFATVSNDSLTGLAARDGVTPLAGDRALVKNQTVGADNGLYLAAAGAWTRATDMDVSAEIRSGVLIFVNEGTANKDSLWALGTNDPITIGTTSLAFVLIASASGVGAVLPQPTIAALQALDVTNLLDGQTIWVDTLRRFFQLRATALTQDLKNYSKVNSTASGRQWWDLGYPNLTWLASASTGVPWRVDNTATNEGDGITAPVRTFSELVRRLHGLFYTTPDIIDVEITGSLDVDDPIDIQWGHADADQAGRTRIYGVPTVVASGEVTFVDNFDVNNIEQYIETDIDIDAHLGKQIRFNEGGPFKGISFIDEIVVPGSGYGLKNPTDNDNVAVGTEPPLPSANPELDGGDLFEVIDFPTAPDFRVDTPNHQYAVVLHNVHVTGSFGFASMATDENAGLAIVNSRLSAQTYSHKVQMVLFGSTMDTPASPFTGSFGMSGGGVNATPGVPFFEMRERGGTFLGFGFHPKFNRCAPRFIDMDVEVSSGEFCVFRAPLGTPVLSLGPNCSGKFDLIWGDFNLDYGVRLAGGGNRIQLSELEVTCALAELRFAVDAVDAVFDDLSFTNINDQQGNELSGLAGVVAQNFIRLKCKDASGWIRSDVVRSNGVAKEGVKALADTAANAKGILGASATSTVLDAFGLVAALGQPAIVNHVATPVIGAVAYLSAVTAGKATNTVPPASGTNQKVRLGSVYDKTAVGPFGYVVLANQVVPHLSDGIDPSSDIVGAPSLDVNDDVQHAVIGMTEEVAAEFTADFTLMQPALIRARLTALTSQTGGATGTYRVRVGGTPGAADGTVVATLATTNASYPSTPDGVTGGSFANPAGRSLVKITAVASLAGQEARVRGAQIVFVTA